MLTEARPLQHPVPMEILTAIGDITVSFAMLESQMQNLSSWLFRGNDKVPNIVTSFLSFKNLMPFLDGLYQERLGKNKYYDQLSSLLKRARDLEELRNQITHSVWMEGEGPNSVHRMKCTCRVKKGLKFNFQHMTLSDFEKIALNMKILASDFFELMVTLTNEGLIDNSR